MLFHHLTEEHAGEITVEQLRPAMQMRASRLPWLGRMHFAWNVDRLFNRFGDYPHWLRRQVDRFDLFHVVDHSYAQLVLELPPERTIVHCHDLDAFRCVLDPDLNRRPRWFRAMTQRSLDGFMRAAHVVCISASTKAELLRYGLFPEDQVSVIHLGVDRGFSRCPDPPSDAAADRLIGSCSSQQPCLLHVGSTIRRKRIDVLLRVFASILDEFPQARLIRVGGGFTEAQSRLAADLGLSDKIVLTPYLETAILAAVYRKAAILLQTSDAEGFGLPVIEALASGCPVVAADIAPLREAGGYAASYCPVGDVEAWSRSVLNLLRERVSASERWEHRRKVGQQHGAQFTWPETARKTAATYRRIWDARQRGTANGYAAKPSA